MSGDTFATATRTRRVQMLEDALERSLDLDGIDVDFDQFGRFIKVFSGFDGCVCHSLTKIAEELEDQLK